MKYPFHLFFLCLFLMLVSLNFLTACGPDAEALQATAAVRIAHAVTVTIAARPESTPYPTSTSYSTHTPYATATHYATAIPYPSTTPYPTATPYPTFTPELFPTQISTPTQTTNAPPAGNTPASVPNAEILLVQSLRQLHAAAGVVTGLIDTATENNGEVDCQAFLQPYDQIMALPTIDVSAAALPLQGAYGEYRAAIEEFGTITTGYANRCRTLLAALGTASIPHAEWAVARFELTDLLEQIGTILRLVGGE